MLKPKRLLIRFIISAVLLFSFFMILSYSFFLSNSNQNLQQYFSQIYSHTMKMVTNLVSENEIKLNTLAGLPQFQDEFRRKLEIYQEYLKPDPETPESLNYIPSVKESRELSLQFPEQDVPGGAMPIFFEYISLEGIIVSGNIPYMRYKPFPYFNRLVQSVNEGRTSGIITVLSRTNVPGEPVTEPTTVIYFYTQIEQDDGRILGYLVSELRADVFLNRPFVSGAVDDSYTMPADTGIYSLHMKVDQYLVGAEGKPASAFLYKGEYSENLKNAGYTRKYANLPVSNPMGKEFKIGETNIPLIRELLAGKKSDLLRYKKSYRNYANRKVYGSAFWMKELGLGMVIEIDAAVAFRPYWASFGLVFIILLLSFAVFLYLILWINRLRVEALDSNPLTQMPGNRIINQKIQSVLDEGGDVAVVYGDLDNFKAFNDTYGFSMGDVVIQFTAEVVKSVIEAIPSEISFCGHIGGDDFIFIVPGERVTDVAEEIGRKFEDGIRKFYNEEHLKQGGIEERNREGTLRKFPIMSFSMAGVLIGHKHLIHYLEVANRCGELKKISKKMPGSTLVLDRRE